MMVAPAPQAAGRKDGPSHCVVAVNAWLLPACAAGFPTCILKSSACRSQSVLHFSSLVEVEELRTVEGSPVLGLQWVVPYYCLGNAHPGCFLICEAELVVPLCQVIVRIAGYC